MTKWEGETLLTFKKRMNGYWQMCELPVEHTVIHRYRRSFQNQAMAEHYATTQYFDVVWVSPEEMEQECQERIEQYHHNEKMEHALTFSSKEKAQNVGPWIAMQYTPVDVQPPCEAGEEWGDVPS